jgi:hypothetical protein
MKDKNGVLLNDNDMVKFQDPQYDPWNMMRSYGTVKLFENKIRVDNKTGNYYSCSHDFYPTNGIIYTVEKI